MTLSNFTGGFSGGLALRNKPLYEPMFGNTWYVDSGAGHSGYGTFAKPFLTLNEAITKCRANAGDTIYVAAGHTEDVASAGAIALDKAGINIIGLGTGFGRPVFDFTTAITATITVTANNITVQNIRFRNEIDNLTTAIVVTGANFTMINCETIESSAVHTDNFITLSTGANGTRLFGWVHNGRDGATGPVSALTMVGLNNVIIQPHWVIGDFSTAAINNTAAATDLQIFGDAGRPAFIQTLNAADVIVACHASTTGFIGPNIYARLLDNAANITEAFVMAGGVFFDPIMVANLAGERGMQFNAVASTDA